MLKKRALLQRIPNGEILAFMALAAVETQLETELLRYGGLIPVQSTLRNYARITNILAP